VKISNPDFIFRISIYPTSPVIGDFTLLCNTTNTAQLEGQPKQTRVLFRTRLDGWSLRINLTYHKSSVFTWSSSPTDSRYFIGTSSALSFQRLTYPSLAITFQFW